MLNFSFKKKSADKSQDLKKDQNTTVKVDLPIQNNEVEEDIFALAAKEEEERNIANVAVAEVPMPNLTPEIPAIADVKEVENKLPDQISQNPAPINATAKQEAAPEASEIQIPEQQPILEDKKIVEIEASKAEIDNNPKENELPAIKPVETNNSENISEEVSQNNQENEANIKAEEVARDNKKFIHPNEQDPTIWVPQLIEILNEMSKEEMPNSEDNK
jgi:hypothetical protein